MDKTLYGVLQVSRDANPDVIVAAYRSLKSKLDAAAAQGDEKARNMLRVVHEAFQTLSDPTKRQRYDASIARKETMAANAAVVEPSPLSRFAIPAIAIMLLVGGGWYYVAQQEAAKERLALQLQEKQEALAKAEEQRRQLEEETASRSAERKRRMEDFQYQHWRDQSRREAADNHRRLEVERVRMEFEQKRQQQHVERQAEMERTRQDAAARRRLEEEKARLRNLQQFNSR